MRHALLISLFLAFSGILFACVPIDAPPEEIDWLSLKGSLLTIESAEKHDMLSQLTFGSDGIRHLAIDFLIDGIVSASFTHQDLDDGALMTIEDAPLRIEHRVVYDLDQRPEPIFNAYMETSGVFEDPEGHILQNNVNTSFDYIVNTFTNLENHYHHYNFLAFYDALSISMSDRQVKPFDADDDPMVFQSTYDDCIADVLAYLQSDLLAMEDYMDVYDVRYGYRYEFQMTPIDFLLQREDPVLGYTFDEETAALVLTANLYVRDNEPILIRVDVEGLPFLLERTLEDEPMMGATLTGPFKIDGMVSISFVLNFFADEPILPDSADYAFYRSVDSFRIPTLRHFLIE